MTNEELANLLYEYADLLEGKGSNPYRIRAYRRGARYINHYNQSIEELLKNNFDLTELPGIGEGLAAQIRLIIETGKAPTYKNNKKPKLSTQKPKTNRRYKLYHVIKMVDVFLKQLAAIENVIKYEVASEYRRKKEVVNELTLLVVAKQPLLFRKKLLALEAISEIFSQDNKRITVGLHSGLLVNVILTPKISFGAALLNHTGTPTHIEGLAKLAARKRLKLTATGLYKNAMKIAGSSEEEIYQHLNLPFIAPELRENRGEIEAAKTQNLPKLIELQDIKGDLHSHTFETDGTESLEAMVNAAIKKGYEYLAITDHSQRLAITNGLNEKRLRAQMEQIDELNSCLKGFKVLKSIEVDIMSDGSLDLPDSVLKELDIRVCSIHSRFRISRTEQTERILRAMDNPYFNILGHATGRLINSRPPYDIDLERLMLAAKERGCFFELNAQPSRLDIKDEYCQMAKAIGVKIAISSDAHSTRELNFMPLGITQARRGWLEAVDVVNTRSWAELKKLLRR